MPLLARIAGAVIAFWPYGGVNAMPNTMMISQAQRLALLVPAQASVDPQSIIDSIKQLNNAQVVSSTHPVVIGTWDNSPSENVKLVQQLYNSFVTNGFIKGRPISTDGVLDKATRAAISSMQKYLEDVTVASSYERGNAGFFDTATLACVNDVAGELSKANGHLTAGRITESAKIFHSLGADHIARSLASDAEKNKNMRVARDIYAVLGDSRNKRRLDSLIEKQTDADLLRVSEDAAKSFNQLFAQAESSIQALKDKGKKRAAQKKLDAARKAYEKTLRARGTDFSDAVRLAQEAERLAQIPKPALGPLGTRTSTGTPQVVAEEIIIPMPSRGNAELLQTARLQIEKIRQLKGKEGYDPKVVESAIDYFEGRFEKLNAQSPAKIITQFKKEVDEAFQALDAHARTMPVYAEMQKAAKLIGNKRLNEILVEARGTKRRQSLKKVLDSYEDELVQARRNLAQYRWLTAAQRYENVIRDKDVILPLLQNEVALAQEKQQQEDTVLQAKALADQGKYGEAATAFLSVGDHASVFKIAKDLYEKGKKLARKKPDEARALLNTSRELLERLTAFEPLSSKEKQTYAAQLARVNNEIQTATQVARPAVTSTMVPNQEIQDQIKTLIAEIENTEDSISISTDPGGKRTLAQNNVEAAKNVINALIDLNYLVDDKGRPLAKVPVTSDKTESSYQAAFARLEELLIKDRYLQDSERSRGGDFTAKHREAVLGRIKELELPVDEAITGELSTEVATSSVAAANALVALQKTITKVGTTHPRRKEYGELEGTRARLLSQIANSGARIPKGTVDSLRELSARAHAYNAIIRLEALIDEQKGDTSRFKSSLSGAREKYNEGNYRSAENIALYALNPKNRAKFAPPAATPPVRTATHTAAPEEISSGAKDLLRALATQDVEYLEAELTFPVTAKSVSASPGSRIEAEFVVTATKAAPLTSVLADPSTTITYALFKKTGEGEDARHYLLLPQTYAGPGNENIRSVARLDDTGSILIYLDRNRLVDAEEGEARKLRPTAIGTFEYTPLLSSSGATLSLTITRPEYEQYVFGTVKGATVVPDDPREKEVTLSVAAAPSVRARIGETYGAVIVSYNAPARVSNK